MERKEVYKAIESEREYQEIQKKMEESHVVEDFPLSSALEAIRYNIEKANQTWYSERSPYTLSMEYMREIAAICVQMGEKYEMKSRNLSFTSQASSASQENKQVNSDRKCEFGQIICPGCNNGMQSIRCAGCGGLGRVTCGKCNGDSCN